MTKDKKHTKDITMALRVSAKDYEEFKARCHLQCRSLSKTLEYMIKHYNSQPIVIDQAVENVIKALNGKES